MIFNISNSDIISLVNNFSESACLSFVNKYFIVHDIYDFYMFFDFASFSMVLDGDLYHNISIPIIISDNTRVSLYIDVDSNTRGLRFTINSSYVLLKRFSYSVYNPEFSYKIQESNIVQNFVFQSFYKTVDNVCIDVPDMDIYSLYFLPNPILPHFKYRTFVSNSKYLDNSPSFLLSVYYEFVFDLYNYQISYVSLPSYSYDVNFSFYKYGSVNKTSQSGYVELCFIDFLDFVSGDVIYSGEQQYVTIRYDKFLQNGVFRKISDGIPSFPSSVDCQFYIDCDDCDQINDYFNMLFYAISKQISKKESEDEEMIDYTPVLTQIATNISNMSNDVNTQLDNINNALHYTNTDDVVKNLTEVVAENDKSVLVENNVIESAPYNPHLKKYDLFEG